MNALPECKRLICFDTDPARLAEIKRRHPDVELASSLDEVLNNDEIDAVVAATPIGNHYELTKKSLLAGKHVLVEKPMAMSSADCKDLIAISRRVGRVLMVGHTFEYSVAVNKAKEIIDSGELGKILYFNFSRLNLGPYRPDVNVVWDLAAHDVSILLYLLQKEPAGVCGHGQAFLKPDIEDVASSFLYFEDGTVALLNDSWLDPYKVRRMTVVGTRKMLVYDDVSQLEKIKVFDKGIDAPASYDTFGEFHFAYRYGDIYTPRLEEQEPLKLECQEFVRAILEGTVPRSDGESGRRVVRILEAISESMRQRGVYVAVNGEQRSARRPLNRPDRQRRPNPILQPAVDEPGDVVALTVEYDSHDPSAGLFQDRSGVLRHLASGPIGPHHEHDSVDQTRQRRRIGVGGDRGRIQDHPVETLGEVIDGASQRFAVEQLGHVG
jgi:predicted dehydrogenase